jgi:S-adenosylmethionine hydrolase
MTDFGIKDGNVGVMKGVIWSIAPLVQISDLSHMIAAQNVREAALVLARSAPYFPANSIHVVVVDPGVGTARRPMAARLGTQFYVGPDNGTLTVLLEYAEKAGWPLEFIHLTKPEFWLSSISHVFHGRDIFSPVAAHLAAGTPLNELGERIYDPVRLNLPKPAKTDSGWLGEIIHIDHFGNLASNIRVEHLGANLENMEKITVRVNNSEIHGLVNTFGERPIGDLVALLGSTGNLIVSVVNGNAFARLNTRVGDPLEIILENK